MFTFNQNQTLLNHVELYLVCRKYMEQIVHIAQILVDCECLKPKKQLFLGNQFWIILMKKFQVIKILAVSSQEPTTLTRWSTECLKNAKLSFVLLGWLKFSITILILSFTVFECVNSIIACFRILQLLSNPLSFERRSYK